MVDAKGQIDIAKAAQLAGMEINDLHQLNPGYNQWATDPKGPHKFVVPVDKVSAFKQNLAALKPEDRMSWNRYVVKNGDTLGGIAAKL